MCSVLLLLRYWQVAQRALRVCLRIAEDRMQRCNSEGCRQVQRQKASARNARLNRLPSRYQLQICVISLRIFTAYSVQFLVFLFLFLHSLPR